MAHPTDQRDQNANEIGRLQSLFREVNERIEELSERFAGHDAMTMLCECGSTDCDGRIAISEPEYETLRRIPTHFAVLPGHDIRAVERVVETKGRYVVVEKFGESAIAAIRLDPRRRA